MRKKKCRFFCLLTAFLLTIFLGGCRTGESISSIPQCRVVDGIRVYYEMAGIHLERVYVASNKVRAILNYLRWIDPYGAPEEDPETAEGSSFRIELHYSDGCSKTYLQKGDRFMKTDDGQWKRIDPDRAQEISKIIGKMESDM